MKTISYNEFLIKLKEFWDAANTKSDIMVLQHPLYNCGPEIENNEYWYIIPGNCHDYISDNVMYDITISDEYMAKHKGDQLRSRCEELYNNANRAIIRCYGDQYIQLYYNYNKEDDSKFINNIFIKEWYRSRKMMIAPFELNDISFKEIWDNKRNNDRIEDTVTKIEYISFDELKNRIKSLHNIEI